MRLGSGQLRHERVRCHESHSRRRVYGETFSAVPSKYYRVEPTEADLSELPSAYIACHGDWAISFIRISEDGVEMLDRDETLDFSDLWDLWFTPVSAWTGRLEEVSAAEFEASRSGASTTDN